MIWLLSILLYVHILGAIFWFGSGMMLRYVLMLALPKMPYEAQHPFLPVIAGNYSGIIGPSAAPLRAFSAHSTRHTASPSWRRWCWRSPWS